MSERYFNDDQVGGHHPNAKAATSEPTPLPVETDAELLYRAYQGLLVLRTVCKKANLSGGMEAADALIKDIGAKYPQFPGRTMLRTSIILAPEERQPADDVK